MATRQSAVRGVREPWQVRHDDGKVNPGQWATRLISARPDDRRWPSLAECRCGLSLRRYIPLSIQILSLKNLPGTYW